MEERRGTDPMIAALISKVEGLERKLDGHMADETDELKNVKTQSMANTASIQELHGKLDTLLGLAQVLSDMEALARISKKLGNFTKWLAGIVAAVAAAITAILNWPNGGS